MPTLTAPKGTRERVLEAARREIGYVEKPAGSNQTKYGAAYGMNRVAWCAEFVWWVFREAGVPLPIKTAYTPALAAAFQREGRWLKNTSGEVRPGDVVLFYWPNMGRIAHTGIVEKILPNGMIQTIEGNTDEAGGRTGGKVMRKLRSRETVHKFGGFGQPNYQEEDDMFDDNDRKLMTDLKTSMDRLADALLSKSEAKAATGGAHFGEERGQSLMDVVAEARSLAKSAAENAKATADYIQERQSQQASAKKSTKSTPT